MENSTVENAYIAFNLTWTQTSGTNRKYEMISSNLSGITKGVTKKFRNLLSFPYLHLGVNLMKSMESVCGILLTKGSGKSLYYNYSLR